MIFIFLIAGLLVVFCIIKNTGNTAHTAHTTAVTNQLLFDAMDDEQKQRVLAARIERDRQWSEVIRKKNQQHAIVACIVVSAILALVILNNIAPTKPAQAARTPGTTAVTARAVPAPTVTSEIDRARRDRLEEAKMEAAKMEAQRQRENEPASGCPVAVFGSKGCNEWEQLHQTVESIRPCAEMRKRGMQAEADRCHKEMREFLR